MGSVDYSVRTGFSRRARAALRWDDRAVFLLGMPQDGVYNNSPLSSRLSRRSTNTDAGLVVWYTLYGSRPCSTKEMHNKRAAAVILLADKHRCGTE